MTHLVVAVREFRGWQDALAAQAARFEANREGVTVEIRAVPLHELEHALHTGEDPGWDIVLALTDWLPGLIGDGRLVDLQPMIDADPPEGWPQGWTESLLQLQRDERGHAFALPYHDGPEVLLYRRDLFEDPDEGDAFRARYGRELTLPADWDEFRQVAEHFNRPDRGLHGCLLAAAPDGHNNVYDFLLQLWTRGGDVFGDGGRVGVADPVAVESLDYLIGLIADGLTQPEPRRHDSVASGELYAAGKAAMMVNWLGYSALTDLPGSPTQGLSACGPIPADRRGGPVSLSVYWVLGVLATSANAELAYAFIRHVISAEMDLITARSGATACRRSTWDDPAILAEFPFYAAMEPAHRVARTLPALRSWSRLNELLNQTVDRAHIEGSARAALEDCARQMDKEDWR